MIRKILQVFGKTTVYLTDGAVCWTSGTQVDADGARHAYHPDSAQGLDRLGNALKSPKTDEAAALAGLPPSHGWAGVYTKDPDGKGMPVVQGPTPTEVPVHIEHAPGYYISTTSLEDTRFAPDDPCRYVDAETVAFISIPKPLWEGKGGPVHVGDLCAVWRPLVNLVSMGLVADVGPAGEIGEMSICKANRLQVPSSPRHGGCANGIYWVVFPGSAPKWGSTVNGREMWPRDVDLWESTARALFEGWGGTRKFKLAIAP